jgi:large subunit ribosomal protein L24
MQIKKNDQVIVISGNDRGKTGKVLKVYRQRGRVVVEGINFRKRATRPTQQNPKGGMQEREMPIHASNVMVICPKCQQGVRLRSAELLGSDGKMRHVRACSRCGEMVGSE